jgi:hypothetical protein
MHAASMAIRATSELWAARIPKVERKKNEEKDTADKGYKGLMGFQNGRQMSRLVVKAYLPNHLCPDRCQRGEVPTEVDRQEREGEGTEKDKPFITPGTVQLSDPIVTQIHISFEVLERGIITI